MPVHNVKASDIEESRQGSFAFMAPELVTAAYKGVLGRAPRQDGLCAHTARLERDRDIAAFLREIIESEEFEKVFKNRSERSNLAADSAQRANALSIVFTHHKCASKWLVSVLTACSAAFDKPLFKTHLSRSSPPQGRNFDISLVVNSDYDTCIESYGPWLTPGSRPALHVIRNPLDIVVSAYYSHLSAHSLVDWPQLAHQRDILLSLDKTSGMLATWVFLERGDFHAGAIGPLSALRRWNFDDPRIKTVRMEDLVGDVEFARSELWSLLGEDPAEILSQFTFDKLSGGRPAGVVDNENHYRSGLPHQWMHEMDRSLARAICQSYKHIIDTYYPDVERLLKT